MVELTGKFQHERNENLDEYFKAVGVPYIPRKMICASSPLLEVTLDEATQQWTIKVNSLIRTTTYTFKLGEEYEEYMPGVTIKSVTTRENDTLKTESESPASGKIFRIYQFTETYCTLASFIFKFTLKHEQSGQEAKRYFKRLDAN